MTTLRPAFAARARIAAVIGEDVLELARALRASELAEARPTPLKPNRAAYAARARVAALYRGDYAFLTERAASC